ncbi:MAG: helix-turn-helix domain-containing protein [Lachnospiraceae bacterium]
MGNSMDYIYTSAEQKILIEVEQKSIRQSVIEQYMCVSRKIQGMTQAELAKRAGIPRTNITRFEKAVTIIHHWRCLVRIAGGVGDDITGSADGERNKLVCNGDGCMKNRIIDVQNVRVTVSKKSWMITYALQILQKLKQENHVNYRCSKKNWCEIEIR